MSLQTIKKEVNATICDSCGGEIVKEKGYCCHNVLSYSKEPLDTNKYGVAHYLFSWTPRKKNDESESVRYDFHPECLDKIITNFIRNKT